LRFAMKEQKFNTGKERNPYISKHPDHEEWEIVLEKRNGTWVWNGDGWSQPFLFRRTKEPKIFTSPEEAKQELKTVVLPYILKWQPGVWEDYVVGHELPDGYQLKTESKKMNNTKKQHERLVENAVKKQLQERASKDENMKTIQIMKELLLRLRTYADKLTAPGETTMNDNTVKDIHKYLEEIEGWLEGYEAFIDLDVFWNRLDSPYRPEK